MSKEGMKQLADAAAGVSAQKNGPAIPQYTFTFPDSVRKFAVDPKTITLTTLDVAGEIHGNKLMGRGEAANVFKKIALAVTKVDGVKADWASGDIDRQIATWSPKVREQLSTAFMSLHRSSDAEDISFLESMTTEI